MSKIHHFLTRSHFDLGLLILRIGIGLQFVLHGWPKVKGGIEVWEKLGKKMALVGLDFGYAFWGFMATFAEFAGGILMILGLFSRPTALLSAFTMLIAALYHWSEAFGDPELTMIKKWMEAGHAFELMVVCIAWYLLGSGRYSLDRKLFHKEKH